MVSRPKRRKPIARDGARLRPADSPNAGAAKLRTISASEFAQRFAHGVRDKQQSFTWFLGAGCSLTSGIKTAGGLVEKWLREEHDFQKPATKDHEFKDWVQRTHPDYDSKNPARYYAQAFEARHPSPAERQREVEMVCASSRPKYGYATLAELVSDQKYGRYCNTILTTNFDDLIADALYLFGDPNARPLVVTHEALTRFVRTGSPRPTVVKLHGDAHLLPKNLQIETHALDDLVGKQLYPFLQDHALIFVGYGGNDHSIRKLLNDCPLPPLESPIYWVSKEDPPELFIDLLNTRPALRVDHTDFDQLMHLVRGALGIKLLDKTRWERIGTEYLQDFTRLTKEIEEAPSASDDARALRSATTAAEKSLSDEWSYYSVANKNARADPELADSTYREGLEKFPASSLLNGMYGQFLYEVRKETDAAEVHFRRAISLDQNEAANLGNFANFLADVRKDFDAAETFYNRALVIQPTNSLHLGNYAHFLHTNRKDNKMAEVYYKRSLQADPNYLNSLANYAQLVLSSGRLEEGLALLDRAERSALNDDPSIRLELHLYRYAHDAPSRNKNLSELKKMLSADVRSPDWSFAATLDRARRDGHPDVPLLEDLIKVTNDEAKIDILDKHAAWRAA